MDTFLQRTWAEINLNNLFHNISLIKKHCRTPVMAVVKADAYGHGDVQTAAFLEKNCGIDAFAVSNPEEGMRLKKAGIKGDILLLGPSPLDNFIYKEYNFIHCIHSLNYAKRLNELSLASGTISRAHIKLDTGMGRIGFNAKTEDFGALCRELLKLKGIKICGLFSHFSHADCCTGDAPQFTEHQRMLFDSALHTIKKYFPDIKTHLQNSAGIIDYSDFKYDYIRPGIIMYGLKPSSQMRTSLDFKPVMQLKSRITYIKQVEKGTPIGYSRTFTAPEAMKIATLPIGYADGYMRAFSNKGIVMINGKKAKVTGNVCMDQIMVDITDIEAKEGDEAVIYGEAFTADDAAAIIGTIGYELVCAVSKRVPRVYIKDGKVLKITDYIA